MHKKIFFTLCFGVLFLPGLHAQVDFKGRLSATAVSNLDRHKSQFFSVRYIPELFLNCKANLDLNLALNGYINYLGNSLAAANRDSDLKLYRFWSRYTQPQFEIRLGLQMINFGPALMLRSLMWFDRIDPRDPLQLTDGVWGLIFRYYFVNNANVWLWTLYGNDETKGWEIFPSLKDFPEFGGRVQIPLLSGEIAATAHVRKAAMSSLMRNDFASEYKNFKETRFALDGRWDAGIGLWFEAAAVHQQTRQIEFNHQTFVTVGADYTFSLGNGLHLLGEGFQLKLSEKFFGGGDDYNFGAFLIDYPVGLIDQIFGFVYFDMDNKQFYRLIRWQRSYDNWSWHLMAFWNPETAALPGQLNSQLTSGGKGFMLIVAFNH